MPVKGIISLNAFVTLAICLNHAAPAMCQSSYEQWHQDLEKYVAARKATKPGGEVAASPRPTPVAQRSADQTDGGIMQTWMRDTLATGSSAKGYLEAVGNPQPGPAVATHDRDPDGWMKILTGASKISYCTAEQAPGGTAAGKHLLAREALRRLLGGGVVSHVSTRQLDSMLAWIKSYCKTADEENSDDCDCAQVLQRTENHLNQQQ